MYVQSVHSLLSRPMCCISSRPLPSDLTRVDISDQLLERRRYGRHHAQPACRIHISMITPHAVPASPTLARLGVTDHNILLACIPSFDTP
jgi:hypothetical protein